MNSKTESALITVGIPTYNTPVEYFDLLLGQVIRQTYRNLDILIVDDGSSPMFLEHLKDVAGQDSRIRLMLKPENKGQYDSRKVILRSIKGDYFAFIDSDDYIPTDYFEKLLSSVRDAGGGRCAALCRYVSFSDKIPVSICSASGTRIIEDRILYNGLKGVFGHSVCVWLFPSEVAGDIDVDPELGFDDAQLIPVFCERIERVIMTQGTCYYYRQRRGSTLHSGNKPLLQAYKTYVNYLKIAEAKCPDAISYIKTMIAFQDFKLCCVDYDREFSSKHLGQKAAELRSLAKTYGYNQLGTESKQIRFATAFPHLFSFAYRYKRKTRN